MFFPDSAMMSGKPGDSIPMRANRLHRILGQVLIPVFSTKISLSFGSGTSDLKKTCSLSGPAMSVGMLMTLVSGEGMASGKHRVKMYNNT